MTVDILKNESATRETIYDFLSYNRQNNADYYAHIAVAGLSDEKRRALQDKIVWALNNA